MKHTKGTWTVQRVQYGTFNVRTGEGVYICQTRKDNIISKEEAEANARLIAAAPDLYEQLDNAFCMISNLNNIIYSHNIEGTYANSEKQRAAIDKILAALKKAGCACA